MYRTVSKLDQRMQKYGAKTLRMKGNVKRKDDEIRNHSKNRSKSTLARSKSAIIGGAIGSIGSPCTHIMKDDKKGGSLCANRHAFNCISLVQIPAHIIQMCMQEGKADANSNFTFSSRSNSAASQKRAIIYMALGYALAWTFAFVPWLVNWPVGYGTTMDLISYTTIPLQGLLNMIVYMCPKVRNAKKSKRQRVTWCQAIVKAWMSKGERRKNQYKKRRNRYDNRGRMAAKRTKERQATAAFPAPNSSSTATSGMNLHSRTSKLTQSIRVLLSGMVNVGMQQHDVMEIFYKTHKFLQ